MQTTKRIYCVDRSRIGLIKFILEAYDNVAVVSTLDPQRAVIQVTIAPGCASLVDAIMRDVARKATISAYEATVRAGGDPQ